MSNEYSYDEQGQFFPYFILTIAAIITVPTTYSWLKPSKDIENTAPRINTGYKPEDADLVATVKGRQRRRERKTKRMILSILGWITMAAMCYLIAVTARTVPKIWDPYEVLGISRSADERKIKSHYRRLSLTLHPDKARPDEATNSTIESINEHWVEVTKAFKALTDEEVRRNYLEYGHPDGKQSFSMGIALPQFLVMEGNGKYVLLFYIGLLGVVLPYIAGSWWYGSQKKTKDGIYVNSAGVLFQSYKDEVSYHTVLEAASGAEEYKELLKDDKAESGLARIEGKILAPGEGQTTVAGMMGRDETALKNMDNAQRRKAFALLWAYLGRTDLGDATLNDEKYEVAPIAYQLFEAFNVIALHFGNTAPVIASYTLCQSIVQAITPGKSALLQIPHFTQELVDAVEGDNPRHHWTVQQFMNLPLEERRRLVEAGLLTGQQFQQAITTAAKFPYLHVEHAFFKVHAERCITPNSLVQFIIKARFIPPGAQNIPEVNPEDLKEADKEDTKKNDEGDDMKAPAPLTHAPFYARDHSPKWHVFLVEPRQGKIVVPPFTFSTFQKPAFDEEGNPTFAMQTLKMQFGAPPSEGRYTFHMHLMSDSYIGMDTKWEVNLDVEDASRAEELGDDGEISEPEEDSIAGQMAMMKGGKVKKSRATIDDESSGSDTEGDEALDEDSTTDTETDED